MPWLERALDAGTRWRRPLTVVLGGLIATAAFFAYQSQRPSADEPAPGRGDGVAAMVDGIEPGRIEPAATVTAAPLGAGTEPSIVSPPGGPTTATASDRSTTTVSRRSGTTARRSSSTTASSVAGGGTAPSDGSSASTGDTSDASTTGSSSTTAPTTAGTPTSASTTVSTTASTTSSTAAKAVFIGDRVSYDDWDGAAAKGVAVTLWSDANRDGREDSVRATATSSDSGAYGFNVEPGCYVVTFGVPSGQSVLKGDQRRALCLGSGQTDARVDLVISRPVTVRAPTSCVVYVGQFNGGVEVRDSSGTFAPSYGFYDSAGKLVLSTATLGAPSSSSRTSRTWSSRNFDERTVVSVAGEDRGNTSAKVTCSRQNVF